MFENLFEEANYVIKQNLEEEADKYILESDNLDEVEFTEGLEEIVHVDDYEEVISESIEDFEDLGLMEYEEIDLDDEDDYVAGDSDEIDDSDEVDTIDELAAPEEDSYTSEDEDEFGDDFYEESWLFELED